MRRSEPLYRKVNTRARGVHHGGGKAFRHDRNTKSEKASEAQRGSMHSNRRNGLDYTPLFRYLLSRVGGDWNDIYSEVVTRLDRPEPIYWLVARTDNEKRPFVRCGDNSYYSGLYIDEAGKLAIVDPTLGVEKLWPACGCCTHTFNGKPFVHKCEIERRFDLVLGEPET